VSAVRGAGPEFVIAGQNAGASTALQAFHEHWCLFFEGLRTAKVNASSASETRTTTVAVEKLYSAPSPS
jgi:hypothetical protein